MTRSLARIEIIVTGLFLALVGPGCSAGPQTIVLRNHEIEYGCSEEESPSGPVTAVSGGRDLADHVFRTAGRPICAAISPDGRLLAFALRKAADVAATNFTRTVKATAHQVVFVDTATLREVRRWNLNSIAGGSLNPHDPTGSQPADLAFTRDGRSIAVLWAHHVRHRFYYSADLRGVFDGLALTDCVLLKPSASRASHDLFGHVRVGMGLYSPSYWFDYIRRCDLIYYRKGVPIGLSREFLPDAAEPRFKLKQGECLLSRPDEPSDGTAGEPETKFVLRDVCFNDARSQVAGWMWADATCTAANVAIWSVPEGELLGMTRTTCRVRRIAFSPEQERFEITLANGTKTTVPQEPADMRPQTTGLQQ